MVGSAKRRVSFGAFQVDLATGELRKHGLTIRLQGQPFQILAALLERPGELITREELVQRLWADGTVVDYEGGLNAAVTRLRQALADSAETPRYVETVARRGYRFIAPVQTDNPPAVVALSDAPALPADRQPPSPKKAALVVLAVAVVAFGVLLWAFAGSQSRKPQRTVVVSPLGIGLGVERHASFSPDGSQVAYEWETQNHERHIYLKGVTEGDPVPLTSGRSVEFGPAWSPDGRLIAFLRLENETAMALCVKPPLGGAERKVADLTPPEALILRRFVRRLAWTADSRHVIVSTPDHPDRGEGLLLVSVEDGVKAWLTPPNEDMLTGDREPAVSPDGRWVAFARGERGASEMIYLLRLTPGLQPESAPSPLTAAGRARSPAWSPDGKEILFTSVNPGLLVGSGVSRIRVKDGSAASPISATGQAAGIPSVSRTGRLAYSRISVESGIWRQEIPARGSSVLPPVRLTKAAAADANAQYSPDGRRIVFASSRLGSREIWSCGSDGEHCRPLTSFHANFATGTPRWSPDGRQIAFDSALKGRMDIYTVDSDGGTPRRVTDDQTRGAVPSWSRDGKWIYFSSSRTGSNEIWKIPSAGGTPVQVTHRGGFSAAESTDGRALYYLKADERSDLFRSELDGSGETLVLHGVAKRGYVVSSDRIYYIHDDSEAWASLRAFMLRTGEDIQISRVAQPLFLGLGLSPDGKFLLYSQMNMSSNLMLAEGVFP